MKIYIPTRGRPHKQIFYNSLPDTWKKEVIFVGTKQEDLPELDYMAERVVAPAWVKNIGDKRQWIITDYHNVKLHGPSIVMVDDDIRIAVRRQDDKTKFRQAGEEDVSDMLNALWRALEDYAHVTVCPREGGNRHINGDVENTRAMRVLGYDVEVLRKEHVDFQRCDVQCDFDTTLQLLRAGYKNLMLANWVQDDAGGSNAPGGCSIYRDLNYNAEIARKLAGLHKGYVKTVLKTTKGAWGGGTRTDVQIQWKKAYASSQS